MPRCFQIPGSITNCTAAIGWAISQMQRGDCGFIFFYKTGAAAMDDALLALRLL
jgi:hypothetical protein